MGAYIPSPLADQMAHQSELIANATDASCNVARFYPETLGGTVAAAGSR